MNTLLYCDCGEVIGKYLPATQEQPSEAYPWNEDLYDEAHNCYCCQTCFERMQEPDEDDVFNPLVREGGALGMGA